MIKFSRKVDYGLVLLVALALSHTDRSWQSLSIISKDYHLSYRFLINVARSLRQAGIIEAKEGMDGGYRLKKNPDSITVSDILKSLLGETGPSLCTSGQKCASEAMCPVKPVWAKIGEVIEESLDSMVLTDLVDEYCISSRS